VLGEYVERLLARKSIELFPEEEKYRELKGELKQKINELDTKIKKRTLSSITRRRLVNDSHALINDGIDRHKLWN